MRGKLTYGLVAVGLLFVMGGCSSLQAPSQRAQLATAYDSYQVTMDILTDLARQNRLTDEQVRDIDRWQDVALSCLKAWEEALAEDREPASAIDAFHEVMRKLSRQLTEVKDDE